MEATSAAAMLPVLKEESMLGFLFFIAQAMYVIASVCYVVSSMFAESCMLYGQAF